MRRILAAAGLAAWLALAVSGQVIPSNFTYKRETGQQSGKPIFSLTPAAASVAYDGELGNSFQSLGALVQPERDIFSIIFMNASPKVQLSKSKISSCTVAVDTESVDLATVDLLPPQRMGRLMVETVGMRTTAELFWKLVKAKDITVRCGPVTYNLDGDNIDALAGFGAQVRTDLDRRRQQ